MRDGVLRAMLPRAVIPPTTTVKQVRWMLLILSSLPMLLCGCPAIAGPSTQSTGRCRCVAVWLGHTVEESMWDSRSPAIHQMADVTRALRRPVRARAQHPGAYRIALRKANAVRYGSHYHGARRHSPKQCRSADGGGHRGLRGPGADFRASHIAPGSTRRRWNLQPTRGARRR